MLPHLTSALTDCATRVVYLLQSHCLLPSPQPPPSLQTNITDFRCFLWTVTVDELV